MKFVTRAYALLNRLAEGLCPLFDLGLRLYIAQVFLRAGLLKISNWPSTLHLFDYIYHVPLLPPHCAAMLGTTAELVFPILLALGLVGRFAAAGLFMTNSMASISFPDISELGLQDHYLWGMILLVLFFHGPGRWSLDTWRTH